MRDASKRLPPAGLLLLAALLAPGAALAADGGWTDVAEFSYVATAGNAETSTLGFKNTLARTWDRSSFKVRAGGIRADSTTVTRFAEGPNANSFTIGETSTTVKTAENYFLHGKYDRKITDRFFWFAGTGWDRNRFTGIENRYVVEGGVGNIWYDTDDVKFRTDYAVTYTDQQDVFQTPGADDSFLGARLSWDYLNKLGQNATYENVLVIDENLDDTSDFRADMVNSLAVSMTEKLALKVSLQLLYDNQPALQLVQLFDPFPNPVVPDTFVPAELDDLDTIFTASLVVNFK